MSRINLFKDTLSDRPIKQSQNKTTSSIDRKFFQQSADRTKPSSIKLVLDDFEEISKKNSIIDQVGAPQTNFAPFGNNLAAESSSTPNAGPTDLIPRVNPLFDFEPYNYVISLSCISKENFNSAGSGEEILIARSGGKGEQSAGVLGNDYYIDNLVIRNTLSPTAEAKSGAVYQVLFDVTEPFGTSFVDALITAAKRLNYENHLKAVFLLNIEFRGIDDNGVPTNINSPYTVKRIPVHIYAVEMNVEAGITTYQLQCVPATYLGQTELHGVTQEIITVTGDTVGEVLINFFEKYNSTLQTLKAEKRIQEPDVYEFSVNESYQDIIDSKIPYDTNSNSANIFNISNVQEGPPNRRRREITIPMGTGIQTFIEALVRESTYYRSQFDTDGQPIKSKEGFLQALRTTTRLEILSTVGGGGGNRPVYKFYWIVRPFFVSENYFKKEAVDVVSNVNPVRQYDYLYTGKNKDILDFAVTYKFGFYQAIPYFKGSGYSVANSTQSGEIPKDSEDEDTTGTTGVGTSQVTTEVRRTTKDGFIADLNTINGEVATIFEQIIQDPSADLLVTQMEILGDPCWIEQKSVINESYENSYQEGSPNLDRFGSVTTDEYEVFVQVNFKTPTDLDDATGLFKIQDAAFFEGKYKVFLCESRFVGGVYTNVLQMVRMRHQPTDFERENLGQSNSIGTTGDGSDPTGTAGGSGVDGDNTTDNVLNQLPTPKIYIDTDDDGRPDDSF